MTAKGRMQASEASMAGEIAGRSIAIPRVGLDLESSRAATIVPLPATAIPPVTCVRSTLLASSLQAIRERSLVDAYMEALPRRHHDQVLRTLAPVWLPLDAAMAHYQAMDSLRLPDDQVLMIGRSVGERLQGTFLGTLVRGVRHAGVTPWSLAGKLERVWSRVFDGGAIGVVKLGPKDGVMSIRGLPLLSIGYFRLGWQAVVGAGIESIARKCYVREVGKGTMAPDAIDVAISWV